MKILIVRMSAMGDIVHTLPSAAALRRAYPDAEIDWLVEDRWSGLLLGNPHLTALRRLRGKRSVESLIAAVRELRARRYDCVIDFQGLLKSAAIARLCGAREIIGFETAALREKPAAIAYTRHVSVPLTAHVVDQNLALARAAGAADGHVEFPLPPGEPGAVFSGDFLAVSPSAGWRAKRWPPEKFAELVARVDRELGWPTAVNCGPGEEELARRAVAGRARVVVGDIAKLIGLARRARAFIAGDTGPLHVAAAVGTPVVAIFGPTSPERNGPYSERSRVVRAPGAATTYSRSAGVEDVARVSVEDVFRALVEVTAS